MRHRRQKMLAKVVALLTVLTQVSKAQVTVCNQDSWFEGHTSLSHTAVYHCPYINFAAFGGGATQGNAWLAVDSLDDVTGARQNAYHLTIGAINGGLDTASYVDSILVNDQVVVPPLFAIVATIQEAIALLYIPNVAVATEIKLLSVSSATHPSLAFHPALSGSNRSLFIVSNSDSSLAGIMASPLANLDNEWYLFKLAGLDGAAPSLTWESVIAAPGCLGSCRLDAVAKGFADSTTGSIFKFSLLWNGSSLDLAVSISEPFNWDVDIGARYYQGVATEASQPRVSYALSSSKPDRFYFALAVGNQVTVYTVQCTVSSQLPDCTFYKSDLTLAGWDLAHIEQLAVNPRIRIKISMTSSASPESDTVFYFKLESYDQDFIIEINELQFTFPSNNAYTLTVSEMQDRISFRGIGGSAAVIGQNYRIFIHRLKTSTNCADYQKILLDGVPSWLTTNTPSKITFGPNTSFAYQFEASESSQTTKTFSLTTEALTNVVRDLSVPFDDLIVNPCGVLPPLLESTTEPITGAIEISYIHDPLDLTRTCPDPLVDPTLLYQPLVSITDASSFSQSPVLVSNAPTETTYWLDFDPLATPPNEYSLTFAVQYDANALTPSIQTVSVTVTDFCGLTMPVFNTEGLTFVIGRSGQTYSLTGLTLVNAYCAVTSIDVVRLEPDTLSPITETGLSVDTALMSVGASLPTVVEATTLKLAIAVTVGTSDGTYTETLTSVHDLDAVLCDLVLPDWLIPGYVFNMPVGFIGEELLDFTTSSNGVCGFSAEITLGGNVFDSMVYHGQIHVDENFLAMSVDESAVSIGQALEFEFTIKDLTDPGTYFLSTTFIVSLGVHTCGADDLILPTMTELGFSIHRCDESNGDDRSYRIEGGSSLNGCAYTTSVERDDFSHLIWDPDTQVISTRIAHYNTSWRLIFYTMTLVDRPIVSVTSQGMKITQYRCPLTLPSSLLVSDYATYQAGIGAEPIVFDLTDADNRECDFSASVRNVGPTRTALITSDAITVPRDTCMSIGLHTFVYEMVQTSNNYADEPPGSNSVEVSVEISQADQHLELPLALSQGSDDLPIVFSFDPQSSTQGRIDLSQIGEALCPVTVTYSGHEAFPFIQASDTEILIDLESDLITTELTIPMTYTQTQDKLDPPSLAQDFTIVIRSRLKVPLTCTPSLVLSPLQPAFYTYMQGNEALEIDLSDIVSNGDCEYSLLLLGGLEAGEVDSDLFTLNQATFEKSQESYLGVSVREGALIEVWTDDPGKKGVYQLELWAVSAELEESITFTVEVQTCVSVTQDSAVEVRKITYRVSNGPLEVFIQSKNVTCPNTQFAVIKDGAYFLQETKDETLVSLAIDLGDQATLAEKEAIVGFYNLTVTETDTLTSYSMTTVIELTIKPEDSLSADQSIANFLAKFSKKSNNQESSALVPPKATVYELSPTGNLTLYFSKPIILPPIRLVTDQQRRLEDLPELSIKDIVSLTVDSPYNQEASLAQESTRIEDYFLTRLNETAMDIQVVFAHPAQVTQSLVSPDKLQIQFNQGQLFMDQTEFQQMEQELALEIEIGPQMSQEEYEELMAFEETLMTVTSAFSVGNLILNLILAVGLKYLWNMVNLLQFAVFMRLWQVLLPTKANVFLKSLKTLALFEFLPTDQLMDKARSWFGLEEGGAASILNELALLILAGSLLFALLVLVTLLFFLKRICSKAVSCYTSLKQKLFWGMPLRYLLLGTLKTQVTLLSPLVIGHSPEAATSDSDASVFTLTLLAVLTLMPALLALVLCCNRDNLEAEAVKSKIGALYELHDASKEYVGTYSIVFLIRRSLFVALTFCLYGQPTLQVMAMLGGSMLYLGYITQMPFYLSKAQKAIEATNECFLIALCYHFVLLTDPSITSHPAALKNPIGTSMISFIASLLALNTLIILGVNFSVIRSRCRRSLAKRRHQKQMRAQAQKQGQGLTDAVQVKPDGLAQEKNLVLDVSLDDISSNHSSVLLKQPALEARREGGHLVGNDLVGVKTRGQASGQAICEEVPVKARQVKNSRNMDEQETRDPSRKAARVQFRNPLEALSALAAEQQTIGLAPAQLQQSLEATAAKVEQPQVPVQPLILPFAQIMRDLSQSKTVEKRQQVKNNLQNSSHDDFWSPN